MPKGTGVVAAGAALVLELWIPTGSGAQPMVLRRPDAATQASAEIIGGSKAATTFWPATFIFEKGDGEYCTATAIGPRVFVTAAHCVADGATGSIKDAQTAVACTWHGNHSSGKRYDVALCLTDKALVLEHGALYETVSVDPLKPSKQESVVLLGFGCTAYAPGAPKGVLYQGGSYVDMPATPDEPYFVTKGGAAICSGDSGGSAYQTKGSLSRRVVGVASSEIGGVESQIGLLADPATVKFMRSWADTQFDPMTKTKLKVQICGLDSTLAPCHG